MQYRLLLHGIESAPLTTDAGIDLVAYSPIQQAPITIQVKTNLAAKPAGGKGKPALNWWLPDASPAQAVALVDLSTDRIWLLTNTEYLSIRQQHSRRGHQLYMWTDPSVVSRKGYKRVLDSDYDEFLILKRVGDLFGVEPSAIE